MSRIAGVVSMLFLFGFDAALAQPAAPGPAQPVLPSVAPNAAVPGQPATRRVLRPASVRAAEVPAAKVQKIVRPAVPTREFTLADLAVRKGVAGKAPAAEEDVELTGLPKKGRVSVKASQLLREANELERKLNATGHSLRDKGPQKLSESKLDRAALANQRTAAQQKVRALAAPVRRATMPVAKQEQTAHQQAVPRLREAIQAQKAGNATPVDMQRADHWEASFGDRDIVAAALKADLNVSGTPAGVAASASGEARIVLFRQDFEVLKIAGGGSAPNDAPQKATFSARVVGMDLFDPVNESGTQLAREGTEEVSFDRSVEVSFAVGPIPMVARFGAHGGAGVRWGYAVSPSYMHVQAVPFLDASAYGECAVGNTIAEAGIGGALTVIDQDLELAATVAIDPATPTTSPKYRWEYYALEKLNVLSGEIYAYARVDYAIDTWEGRHTIFSWDGMSLNGYLFGQKGTMDMFTGGIDVAVTGPATPQANPNYCPEGKFSTMGEHKACKCKAGNKVYGGIASSHAWCASALTCPTGKKFSTTDRWRGCACPPGTKKKYYGLFDKDAKCQ